MLSVYLFVQDNKLKIITELQSAGNRAFWGKAKASWPCRHLQALLTRAALRMSELWFSRVFLSFDHFCLLRL